MSDSHPSAAELFRDHLGWIQGLARALVADRHEAEELAQEVCLAALRSGPRDPSRLRAWLGAVTRNLRRERLRASARRVEREQRAARGEAVPAGSELVERVALERELAGAVLELDEPFRSAILLRFFEELPPREIARRLDVPVATVHSRIGRGLERLRARLGGRAGLERRLSLVLVPLLAPARDSSTLVLGALVVNTKLALSAAALALVLCGAFLVLRPAREATPEPVHAAAAASEQPLAPLADAWARPLETRAAAPEAEPAPGAQAASERAAPPALATGVQRVEGRAFDADGAPLPGLALAAADERGRVLATSAAGGRFAFESEREELVLVPAASQPEWVEVRGAVWSARSRLEPTLVAARALTLAGRVLDEDGAALAGTSVALDLPAAFAARFPTSLEASETHGWRVRSGADGSFRLARVPSVAGALLTVALDGYALARLDEPSASSDALVVVLARPRASLAGSLRGRVVDPTGRAVEGARVGVGLTSVLSARDGSFAIDLARAVTARRVVAVKAGFLPAVLEREPEPGAAQPAWEEPLELVLGGEPLTISGRVLDAEGEPRGGARVWLADPTRFGAIGRMPATLEGLAAGALVPPQALESAAHLPEQDGGDFWDETVPASAPSTALWSYARADGEGRFVLEGLAPRDYRLATMDERTLQLCESEPIPAGAVGVELRLPRVELRARLAGRVVTASGRGVPGVQVELLAQPFGLRTRVFGGTSDVSFWQRGATAVSDAEGRFTLADVPRTPLFLSLESEEIVPRRLALAPDEEGESLTLVVDALCRFEVALRPPFERADAIALRDGEGRPLDLLVFSRGSTNAYSAVPLVEGRTGWLAASSEARTLLLLREGEPVEQLPVQLVPGEERTLEP